MSNPTIKACNDEFDRHWGVVGARRMAIASDSVLALMACQNDFSAGFLAGLNLGMERLQLLSEPKSETILETAAAR